LIAHPKLDGGRLLAGAETVAVSLLGAQDLRMADVNKVMSELGNHWQGTSHLLSASVSAATQGPLSALLLIVSREAAQTASRLGAKSGSEAAEFGTHFLSSANEPKNAPRFNPAAEESASATTPRTRNSRTRENKSRMKQGQLQLDIANKGRFEKSEPTIHKGEDLDVPTFIRRGVVLN
jgi:cell division protein FtsZ